MDDDRNGPCEAGPDGHGPPDLYLDKQYPLAYKKRWRGNNSVVECNLAKVKVAGSNPVSRSSPLLFLFPLPSRRGVEFCMRDVKTWESWQVRFLSDEHHGYAL